MVHVFQCFLPYSRSKSVHFSFWTFFTVSHHNPGFTVSVSQFPCFSLFSPYSRSYSVHFCFSRFFFLPYSRLYRVVFSNFKFCSFLRKIQVLRCAFLIFRVFSISCHNPGPKVFISHFPRFSVFCTYPGHRACFFLFSCFSILPAMFHVIQCLCLIFHLFQVSCHIPSPTVYISHIQRLSVFLAIFQVIQCLLRIFQVF